VKETRPRLLKVRAEESNSSAVSKIHSIVGRLRYDHCHTIHADPNGEWSLCRPKTGHRLSTYTVVPGHTTTAADADSPVEVERTAVELDLFRDRASEPEPAPPATTPEKPKTVEPAPLNRVANDRRLTPSQETVGQRLPRHAVISTFFDACLGDG